MPKPVFTPRCRARVLLAQQLHARSFAERIASPASSPRLIRHKDELQLQQQQQQQQQQQHLHTDDAIEDVASEIIKAAAAAAAAGSADSVEEFDGAWSVDTLDLNTLWMSTNKRDEIAKVLVNVPICISPHGLFGLKFLAAERPRSKKHDRRRKGGKRRRKHKGRSKKKHRSQKRHGQYVAVPTDAAVALAPAVAVATAAPAIAAAAAPTVVAAASAPRCGSSMVRVPHKHVRDSEGMHAAPEQAPAAAPRVGGHVETTRNDEMKRLRSSCQCGREAAHGDMPGVSLVSWSVEINKFLDPLCPEGAAAHRALYKLATPYPVLCYVNGQYVDSSETLRDMLTALQGQHFDDTFMAHHQRGCHPHNARTEVTFGFVPAEEMRRINANFPLEAE